MEEAPLVRRCQEGDTAAFEALFRLYSRRVLQTAYLITGNRATAEDVLQETFTQTFRTIGQLREAGAFPSWLYRITVRCARKHLRPETPLREAHEVGVGRALDEAVAERHLVWAAIAKLPDQHRIAIVLHYFLDRPVTEIAELMEAPAGTVKSWLHRARSALALELNRGGEEIHG